jgi:hypothetical protein
VKRCLVLAFVAEGALRKAQKKNSLISEVLTDADCTMTIQCPDGSIFSLIWSPDHGGLQVCAESSLSRPRSDFVTVKPVAAGRVVLIAR